MRRKTRSIFVLGILLSTICMLIPNALAVAEPDVEMEYYPEEITPLSTVSFNATITGENISDVFILIQECDAITGVCNSPMLNISMEEIDDGIYTADAKLVYEKATYITYWVNIQDDEGNWSKTTGVKIDLTIPPTNGDSDGNNGKNNGNTPGFELILLIFAVMIGIVLFKRKRLR
jgi:hypothetical protein